MMKCRIVMVMAILDYKISILTMTLREFKNLRVFKAIAIIIRQEGTTHCFLCFRTAMLVMFFMPILVQQPSMHNSVTLRHVLGGNKVATTEVLSSLPYPSLPRNNRSDWSGI